MTDIDTILADRARTHGDFHDHASCTQQLKECMKGTRPEGWRALDECQKEALEMIVHKIGRIIAGNPNEPDHWDDIAGYARLISNRLQSNR